MIKDYAIRHFIFKSYIKNVEKDLREVSALIYSNLQNTLLVKEEVLVNNREGLIVRFSKEKYYILLKRDYAIIKCKFEEVVRKQRLDRNEILDTLQFITYETPLGVRLLKKNIYGYITDKSSIKEYLSFLKKTPGSTFSDKCAELEDLTKESKIDKSAEKGKFINNGFSSFNPDQKNTQDFEIKDLKFAQDFEITQDFEIKDSKFAQGFETKDSNITEPVIKIEEYKRDTEVKPNIFHYQDSKNLEDDKNTKKNFKNLDISLEIPPNEIYEIPEFDFNYVNKILRIYSFIYNFCPNKVLLNVNINKLVKSFKEPSYVSDIIGAIHGFLIENLIEEKKTIGLSNLLTNVKSVIDSITDNSISDEIHIGNEVGMRGWKLKTRMLLLEMYKNTNNKKILSYYNVLNKKSPFEPEETVNLRISTVEFLINCFMATNLFRDIILNEIKKVRSLEAKAIELSKIYNTQKDEGCNEVSLEDINNKLAGIKKKIVLSPAKADIGLLNGAKFFLVNDEILMSKNGTFYLPSRNTLEVIIEKYVPIDKVEISTLNNLRNIIETLYINKL